MKNNLKNMKPGECFTFTDKSEFTNIINEAHRVGGLWDIHVTDGVLWVERLRYDDYFDD